jgi:hypothetical protein
MLRGTSPEIKQGFDVNYGQIAISEQATHWLLSNDEHMISCIYCPYMKGTSSQEE